MPPTRPEPLVVDDHELVECQITSLSFEALNTRLIVRCVLGTDASGEYARREEERVSFELVFDLVQEVRIRNGLTPFQMDHIGDLSPDALEASIVVVEHDSPSLQEYRHPRGRTARFHIAFLWERLTEEVPARRIDVVCGVLGVRERDGAPLRRLLPPLQVAR